MVTQMAVKGAQRGWLDHELVVSIHNAFGGELDCGFEARPIHYEGQRAIDGAAKGTQKEYRWR
jgi:hypothetical protein